ncbi:hypothetical protein CYMTET_18736, partial [Cymbomonas tetramitiformis]
MYCAVDDPRLRAEDYNPKHALLIFSKRPWRLLFRLAEVANVLVWIVGERVIDRLQHEFSQDPARKEAQDARRAAKLRTKITQLGPTFVKIAQSASVRKDLFGELFCDSLTGLLDDVEPFATSIAYAVLEEEIGIPSEVFSTISSQPVAAASFGQVYRASLSNGQQVAVKVQRPGVLESVAMDVCILRLALRAVSRLARTTRDLGELADEIGRSLYSELDYCASQTTASRWRCCAIAVHVSMRFRGLAVLDSVGCRKDLMRLPAGTDRPPAGTDRPPAGTDRPPAGTDRPPAGTDRPPAGTDRRALGATLRIMLFCATSCSLGHGEHNLWVRIHLAAEGCSAPAVSEERLTA